MKSQKYRLVVVFVGLLLLLIPGMVLGKCTCSDGDEDGDNCDKKLALMYKLVAIASILVASATGFFLPVVVGKKIPALGPDGRFSFIVKAFLAGVLLAIGFNALKDHPWTDFPVAGYVVIGILMADSLIAAYFAGDLLNAGKVGDVVEVGPGVDVADVDSSFQLFRHRNILQVLDGGFLLSNCANGIEMGVSGTPKTIRALVTVLTFRQFFEGMVLGGCIAQAKLESKIVKIKALSFSLATPFGILIGLDIANEFKENNMNMGIYNSASAGILIYIALLLATDFINPRIYKNVKLQFVANVSLLLGAGLMSLLAKWA